MLHYGEAGRQTVLQVCACSLVGKGHVRATLSNCGKLLKLVRTKLHLRGNTAVARLISSGTVIMLEIGQSAAKLLPVLVAHGERSTTKW